MTFNYTEINLNGKVLVARLTVDCHKFLKGLFYKRTTREALAYFASTQFSLPCRQNITYRLSQITFASTFASGS